jgi:hypothetical protein
LQEHLCKDDKEYKEENEERKEATSSMLQLYIFIYILDFVTTGTCNASGAASN